MKHRLVQISAALLLSSMMLSGCSETNVIPEKTDDTITMDWYVNYSWFVTDWGENMVSKEITDQTGVDVNFITPIGNETNKLNTLIDSNTLPDIVTVGWWEPQIKEMIDSGLVYSLNELADKYDPSFYDVTSSKVRDWYTLSDGNIYGYPNSSYTPEDVLNNDNIAPNPTFLVRKDIYEAIGSPDMSTPENFYNAVVKAKEMFPEVDGKPLIPVGGHEFNSDGCVSFDQYLQCFLAVPYEKDGKKYDRYTDPEYLTWLRMFRKLTSEGYIPDDVFVDQRTQTSEKIEEGRYFCMLYQRTDMADQEKILYDKNPDKIYIAVDGPRNSKGDDPVLPVNGIAGWTLTFISKNCKDPERAIKLMDYLMSEKGQKLTYLGIEGKTYDMIQGKPVLKPEVKELLSSDREAYNALYGADNTYWMLQNNVMQLKWQTELDEPLKQMSEWACQYAAYVGQYEVYINEDSELGRIYASTRSLWGKTLPMLLLARSDIEFDNVLKDYLEQRQKLGYDKLAEEETRQIKINKEKLGIE
ncbi:extracellular solute-binding protein [Butyrivibrio sp. WCE2006]|uniref:extracellular solute-binding protein n=1 Tax=Butyrivibrio sp. WCE2006 TaxID=1410611 RepID=UPI0005D1E513|nr:extracellular solute-binding protein [Butyrivibrio sp. WCE2006]